MKFVKTAEDSQPFAERPSLEFDGIVFLLNPKSTHARRMRRFCDLIMSDYPSQPYNIREFETHKKLLLATKTRGSVGRRDPAR